MFLCMCKEMLFQFFSLLRLLLSSFSRCAVHITLSSSAILRLAVPLSVGTQAFLIGCVVDNDGGDGLRLRLLLLLVGTASEKGTYHRHYDPHLLSFINFFFFFFFFELRAWQAYHH